ncbi:glycosyltransferase [Patescibacteria group bacterium]|nr:glycosyltransferase [Patescibacteria group bacterium]
MFNQSHKLVKVINGNIQKYYPNIKQLKKVWWLKNLLKPNNFVPKVIRINWKERFVEEEKISGNQLNLDLINSNKINTLAKTLKKLHSQKLSISDQKKLADKYTNNFIYQPKKIFKSIFLNLSKADKQIYKKYISLADKLETYFSKQVNLLSMIHGDLRPENILIDNKKNIKIVDWDDCRLDLPLVDVYIFFHNFNLNDQQQKEFWSIYQKPKYWSTNLDKFFKVIQKMWSSIPEPVSIVMPTYNRCPHKKASLNPLFITVASLLGNKNNIIKNIIIGDDCSTDYTQKTVEFLKRKYKSVNFIYFKNQNRCKASFTRQKAIKLCPTQLFLMTDDDCIFPPFFIKNAHKLFTKIRSKDRHLAVLNFPYVNKKFDFNGTISVKQLGKVDYKNHWIYHNLDKLPKKIKNNYIKVDTFEGIFLAVKETVMSVGGFEDLRDFIVDYAEHIGLSWKLTKAGYSLYHAIGKNYLVTHLKYGDHDPNLDLSKVPKKYIKTLKMANKIFIQSGDRVHWLKTLESFISSFTYFYFCISLKEGLKHIKKEVEFLERDNNLNKETLKAYKDGILTAIKVAKKKKLIKNEKLYLSYLNKEIKKANLKISPH